MVKSINTEGYVPGSAVFLSALIPGDEGGCKGRYTIEVYQQGTSSREIKGMNYDPGSPGNDTFPVLSSTQADPTGALIRVVVYLQKMKAEKFTFEINVQQNDRTLVSEVESGEFTSGEVSMFEYDIFCV